MNVAHNYLQFNGNLFEFTENKMNKFILSNSMTIISHYLTTTLDPPLRFLRLRAGSTTFR